MKFRLAVITILVAFAGVYSGHVQAAENLPSFQNFQIKNLDKMRETVLQGLEPPGAGPMMRGYASAAQEDKKAPPVSPVLDRIWRDLRDRYRQIGEDQVDRVRRNNGFYWDNDQNNIGFGYQKSFLDFSVNFNRQLEPDLFDDNRWIVIDTLNIYIDAEKFIGRMRDEDVLDITDENLAAYAGVVFRRSYTYKHFASSYEEGLTAAMDKLFLSFRLFDSRGYLDMREYEILEKEDSISASMAAFVSGPLGAGFSGAVGVHGKYNKLSKVSVHMLGPLDEKDHREKLRFGHEKTEATALGVSVALQLDFFKLLKFTLLSFDLTYEFKETYNAYLSFHESELPLLEGDGPVAEQMRRVLKGKRPDLDVMGPYLESEELRRSKTTKARYAILLMGGMREQETEISQISKNGIQKTFFKHNFEKIDFQQSFWDRLVQAIVRSFIGLDTFVNKVAHNYNKVSIEYESEKNYLDREWTYFRNDDGEKISFRMSTQYMARKTKGGNKYRRRLVERLVNFTPLSSATRARIENDTLVGPMRVTANFQMGKPALDYFHTLSVGRVTEILERLCRYGNHSSSTCKRRLISEYDYYMKTVFNRNYPEVYSDCRGYHGPISGRKRYPLSDACMEYLQANFVGSDVIIPLSKFKDFLRKLSRYSNRRGDLFRLFGEENVFSHGQLEAYTQGGVPYITHFKDGEFKGLGVIDDFRRGGEGRSPASVAAY